MTIHSRRIPAAILLVPLCLLCWACGDDQETETGPTHLTAAFDGEFLMRPDGYDAVKETYGFDFTAEPTQMGPALMYQAVAKGETDVIDAFATDGRIAAYDLRVLDDDRQAFPPYYAAPLVRQDTLEKYPGLEETLNLLGGSLTNADMQKLNYAVDEDDREAAAVAHNFLHAQGLLRPPGAGATERERQGVIVVGGKHFTEQDVLCEIMAQLIEDRLDVTVERKNQLAGTMVCFNSLAAGDIDLYAEYTGTGLMDILKRDKIDDPDEAYATVKEAFAEEHRLVWLEPFGINNAYTLTMRDAHAEELGIESISDLAAYVNRLQSEE